MCLGFGKEGINPSIREAHRHNHCEDRLRNPSVHRTLKHLTVRNLCGIRSCHYGIDLHPCKLPGDKAASPTRMNTTLSYGYPHTLVDRACSLLPTMAPYPLQKALRVLRTSLWTPYQQGTNAPDWLLGGITANEPCLASEPTPMGCCSSKSEDHPHIKETLYTSTPEAYRNSLPSLPICSTTPSTQEPASEQGRHTHLADPSYTP
jgi:hypothetical protein